MRSFHSAKCFLSHFFLLQIGFESLSTEQHRKGRGRREEGLDLSPFSNTLVLASVQCMLLRGLHRLYTLLKRLLARKEIAKGANCRRKIISTPPLHAEQRGRQGTDV
jgi:hypothetical protein